MTMSSPSINYWLIMVLGFIINGVLSSHFTACPVGWLTYQKEIPNTCLYVSDSTTDSLNKAHQKCVEKDASLIVIQSDEKMTYFKEIVQKYLSTNTNIWIGQQRSYSGQVTWLTKDGKIPANNLPSGIRFTNWRGYGSYDNYGLIYKGNTLRSYYNLMYETRDSRYICEMRPECTKGWYGLGCNKECHCHGQECDSNAVAVTCNYGCHVGWRGSGCSQQREDADVRYLCVNSEDQGQYAHIMIDTRGIHYKNIQAMNDDGEFVSWCNNTIIHSNENIVTIRITSDNTTDEAIAGGSCAGKIGEHGKHEWQIKIQEKEHVVSRNDQEVHIECDFSEGDTLKISGDIDITHERWFARSDIKKPVVYLKEKKEKVKLDIVDPATGKTLPETQIGSPVALRITFDLREDSVATGVRPYNCDASSTDSKQRIRFLDDKSCPMEDFPISAFSSNATTKTLTTKPFSLFGFDSTDEVNFNCAYVLCFGDDPCPAGCGETIESPKHNTTTGRHKRIAINRPQRISGTIAVTKYRS